MAEEKLPPAAIPWVTLTLAPTQGMLLLLELCGLFGEPAPHRALVEADRRLSEVLGCIRGASIRDLSAVDLALLKINPDPNGMIELARRLSTVLEIASTEIEPLLKAADAAYQLLVAGQDRNRPIEILAEADAALRSSASCLTLEKMAWFMEAADVLRPIQASCYVLSARSVVQAACTLGNLVIAGLHPATTANQFASIIVHEVLHIMLRRGSAYVLETRPDLEEPVVTALSMAWLYQCSGEGSHREHWYDEASVDATAKLLYPRLLEALQGRVRLSQVWPILSLCRGV